MIASDGKIYNTDCLNNGIELLIDILPRNQRKQLKIWIKGGINFLDEESKKNLMNYLKVILLMK